MLTLQFLMYHKFTQTLINCPFLWRVFKCTTIVFMFSVACRWQGHHSCTALNPTDHNLMGVVGSDHIHFIQKNQLFVERLDWQNCKVKFSGELRTNCRGYISTHGWQSQFAVNTFRRDNSASVHSRSILKTFLTSRKC